MSFLDIFRPLVTKKTIQKWQELGTYTSVFNVFGNDMYKSELVRSCIRPLAELTSKAEAKCSDKSIARILNDRPNMYMNGKDFLYKVRTLTELNNTCFIYIERNELNKVIGFYPVPYQYFEAIEYNNGLFLKFHFANNTELCLAWEDIAAIRKDYNKSDIAGDENTAILDCLDLLATTNQGLANSIKATANLRGILKSTKAMLSPDDIRKAKDTFVNDYMNLSNEGGIASLDSTQEFTPITMNPMTASYEQTKELRENIYRYFGVNENVITSNMTSEQMESFYEMRIEPFLVRLSSELTSKIFSKKAIGFENFVTYEANKLQFCSLEKKITLFKEVVLYGGMTINEWRLGCNMAPIEGGDKPIRRLDADVIGDDKDEEGDNNDGN